MIRISYFVCQPLALIAAFTLRGMLPMSERRISSGIFCHSAFTAASKSSNVLGEVFSFLTFESMMSQRFSIGLRSGLRAGQSRRSKLCAFVHLSHSLKHGSKHCLVGSMLRMPSGHLVRPGHEMLLQSVDIGIRIHHSFHAHERADSPPRETTQIHNRNLTE
jgi:hypothetical protein